MGGYLESARDDMVRRLLDAAGEVLGDEGLQRLTMRKVAERAGCSTMVVYTRFGNKDGLINALLIEGFRRLWDAEQGAITAETPLQTLRALGETYVRTAVTSPHYYRAMFGGGLEGFQSSAEVAEQSRRTFGVLVDAVQACIDAGDMVVDDVARAATLLWSSLHGLVHLHLQGLLPYELTASELNWMFANLMAGLSGGSDSGA